MHHRKKVQGLRREEKALVRYQKNKLLTWVGAGMHHCQKRHRRQRAKQRFFQKVILQNQMSPLL